MWMIVTHQFKDWKKKQNQKRPHWNVAPWKIPGFYIYEWKFVDMLIGFNWRYIAANNAVNSICQNINI